MDAVAAESYARALAAARRLGLDIATEQHGGVFWTARLQTDVRSLLPERARGVRVGGKGRTELQALASCAMELCERLSLYCFAERAPAQLGCLELSTGRERAMSPPRDLWDTKCVAAGVCFEDAILHSLHELVETRLAHAFPWQPYKLVDLMALCPELPSWVGESIVVVRTSSCRRELHHFTALSLPADGRFDERVSERLLVTDEHLFWLVGSRERRPHSPASGSAAGLDPRKSILRAMNEIFQGPTAPIGSVRRCPLPAGIERASPSELVSYEAPSITEDVRLLLELLGADAFVGVIDVTHPVLGIAVVKLVSDWDPRCSLASRETLSMFFELEGTTKRPRHG